MTVSSAVAKKLYSGNGVTTAFATTFQFFDNTDIVVTEIVDATGVETVKTLTTHYTVTGGDGATGTVTMLTAPASGVTLVLEREVPYTQATDYVSNDSFPADAHEQALDKVTMLAQQAIRDVRTSPSLPLSFDPDNDARPVMPVPEANKLVMGTDAEGWENVTVSDLAIASIPVVITAAANGDILMFNGSNWVDATTLAGNYTFSGANPVLAGNAAADLQVVPRQQVGSVPRIQKFSGSGTYTPHAKMVYCVIEAVGGGGGGGGTATGAAGVGVGGGGGGSGGYSRKVALAADIGASQTVTIGAAGAAGTAGNNAGGNGGDTSVGSLCIGKGGTGGSGCDGSAPSAGGAGGIAGTGDITFVGNPGGRSESVSSSQGRGISGYGANSLMGGGAEGKNTATTQAGGAAAGFGGGGSGGATFNAGGTAAGGAGAAGYVIITEFCSA